MAGLPRKNCIHPGVGDISVGQILQEGRTTCVIRWDPSLRARDDVRWFTGWQKLVFQY